MKIFAEDIDEQDDHPHAQYMKKYGRCFECEQDSKLDRLLSVPDSATVRAATYDDWGE